MRQLLSVIFAALLSPAIRVLPGRRLLMTGPAVTVCEGIAKL